MKKIFSYCAIPVATMFGLYLGFASSSVNAGDVNKIFKDTCELCHGRMAKAARLEYNSVCLTFRMLIIKSPEPMPR